MRPKPSIFLLAAVVRLFASLQDVAAQDSQKEISPLNVTGQFSTTLGADCKSGKAPAPLNASNFRRLAP